MDAAGRMMRYMAPIALTSTDAPPSAVLSFDQADRMRKALRHSGLTSQQLADELEVSRNTISAWINGRAKPRMRDLRLFAAATGYDLQWLLTG